MIDFNNFINLLKKSSDRFSEKSVEQQFGLNKVEAKGLCEYALKNEYVTLYIQVECPNCGHIEDTIRSEDNERNFECGECSFHFSFGEADTYTYYQFNTLKKKVS